MKGVLVGPMPDRRWPLHPRPTEWEDLETWVRRIAKIYGVSYDAFLLNALNHTGEGHAIWTRRPPVSSPDYRRARGSQPNDYWK
jgi:hypothetical protein